MLSLPLLKEAWRFYKRARKVNKYGFDKFEGDAEQICAEIVKNCWNGRYFDASTGHFCQFWVRDFAICVEALISLGYKEEVRKTLDYVLNIFDKYDVLTTCLTPEEKPLDVIYYSPDGLPMMLMCLRLTNSLDLVIKYKDFIDRQTRFYYESVFDEKSGLVKKYKMFSEIRDSIISTSSCYNNCMLSLLSDELNQLNLANPFSGFDIKANIMREFWTGEHFLPDLFGLNYVAGDAQIFPFWCGVTDDEIILSKVLLAIDKAGLDQPMPLKFVSKQIKNRIIFPNNIVLNDYQGDSIWMNTGLCFLDVLSRFDKKEMLHNWLRVYKWQIEQNKTFLELFNSGGGLFKKFHYVADEGMLWAAKYLDLVKQA